MVTIVAIITAVSIIVVVSDVSLFLPRFRQLKLVTKCGEECASARWIFITML